MLGVSKGDSTDYESLGASSNDDLLSPSLQTHVGRRTGKKPWRLQSQFWVAFFGGVLPITVIAYLNGKRLGLPRRRQHIVLAAGVAGILCTVVFSYHLGEGEFGNVADRSMQRTVRLGSRVIAVIAYLVLYSLQRAADRTYSYYTQDDEEYSSLWKPGLAAVFGLGLVQGVGVIALVALLRSF
ncbi:MAG: hypothetical protein M3506_10720 [Chloroflexota bacterium]|nr:hypothetical protein [Chloroflexota bacterium]